MAKEPDSQDNSPRGSFGILDSLFSLLFRNSDPDREKKRILKELGKILSKSKFKFYKPRTGEAQPKLARFFYNIYKLTAPAQIMLDHADSSAVFKTILIESGLSDEHQVLKEALSEESIREMLKRNRDRKAVLSKVKENLVRLYAAYDNERVQEIETSYSLFQMFLGFINFDYYFLLRKFDSRFPERDFNYNPNFEGINAEYISDDLKDFMEIFPLINQDANWDLLFNALAIYKGSDVVSRGSWKKLVRSFSEVRNSQVLVQIIQHVDQDPAYRPLAMISQERIVEEYLGKLKTQVEMTIQKVLKEEQSSKIDRLVQEIFGTTAVSRLNYYTEKANMSFSKRMLGGFIHIDALNYLKAFLLDYVKKDVREMINLLIIKGEWPVRITSQQLSESFAALMQITEQLVQFDESLSPEGEAGSALWAVFKRSDRDTNSMTILRQKLKELNDKAYSFIQGAGQNLVMIGKNLKSCLEDYDKSPPEMITNWKVLDTAAGGSIKDNLTVCYKKLYYFIQLIQQFMSKSSK